MTQPTLWSAGAREPAIADLEGLLAGPGQIALRGSAARIGVVVDRDRAAVLTRLLRAELGIDAEVRDLEDGGVAVRTPWLEALHPVARAWQRGALTRPPDRWVLDGPRLRWWCLAAGARHRLLPAYTLRLSPSNEAAWPGVGAALAAAGVAGAFLGVRGGGPAYRVVGRRRLLRLRELVGDPPPGVADASWPPPPLR